MVQHNRAFFIRTRRSDHGDAFGPDPLARNQSHAACRCMEENNDIGRLNRYSMVNLFSIIAITVSKTIQSCASDITRASQ